MSCGTDAPPPQGFAIWKGPVPTPLVQWAMGLRDHVGQFAFGTTWSTTYNDQLVLARCDHHTWHIDEKTGALRTNLCWKGITLYAPLTIDSAPPAGTITTGSGAAPRTLGAAVANPSAGPAVAPDQTTPDPNLAVFSSPSPDWGLVAISAAAGAAVVGLFLLAMHHAGQAPKRIR